MNSTVYIAASILLVLFLFGISLTWYNRYKKKRDKNKLRKEFDDFAIKNCLAIDKKQIINRNMIGIDRMNFKLVFLDKSNDNSNFHLIDLRELSGCNPVREKSNSLGHISRIYVECKFKEKEKKPVMLPFYDEMNDDLFKMLRLSKMASYWEKCINLYRQSALLLKSA